MATLVLTNAVVLWDGFDISATHNQIGLEYGATLLEDTTFGDDTHSRKGGLKQVTMNGSGYWEGGDDAIDDVLFGRIGTAGTALTISPDGGDEGEIAYTFRPVASQYNIGGEVGELMPFTVNAEAHSNLIRGTVMQNGTEGTTGSSTARQLGAVGSGQTLYAALHIIGDPAGTDPTLDVLVRSDDNSGMSSPTTRITFSQATARGAQWGTLAGPVTDDWFDVSFTIGGTSSPSFQFVVVVGIL